jgi:hypothetical protein
VFFPILSIVQPHFSVQKKKKTAAVESLAQKQGVVAQRAWQGT